MNNLSLRDLLFQFIYADDWEESRKIIELNPILLGDEAKIELEEMLKQASNSRIMTQLIVEHQEILSEYREIKQNHEPQQAPIANPSDFRELVDYAQVHTKLYEKSGDIHAIDNAVMGWEKVVNHPDFHLADTDFRLAVYNDGAQSYHLKYWATGQHGDLLQAIKWSHHAIEQAPANSPNLPAKLSNLGNLLLDSFERTGDISELDKAIYFCQQAVDLTHEGVPNRSNFLNNLGVALRVDYFHTQEKETLDKVIKYHKQALAESLPWSSNIPKILANWSIGLHYRFRRENNIADLDQAIQAIETSIDLITTQDPGYSSLLFDLSVCLLSRYFETNNASDLDRVIEIYQQVLDCTPVGSPGRSIFLARFGDALRILYENTKNADSLTEAIKLYSEAANEGLELFPEATLEISLTWGGWASQRKSWSEAVQAFAYGVKAFEQLFESQLLRSDRSLWLRKARNLHAKAAYALAQSGDFERAVTMLEQGRTRALVEVLGLSQLKRIASPADQLSISNILQRLTELEVASQSNRRLHSMKHTFAAEDVRHLRKELSNIIGRIRSYAPEFNPSGLDYPGIAAVASTIEQPLVYFLTTVHGSVGLVVPPSHHLTQNARTQECSCIWLDGFTEVDLQKIVFDEEDKKGFLHCNIEGNIEGLINILDQGWPVLRDKLLMPVTERLQSWGFNHSILIPVGNLGLLPLHALNLDTITYTFASSTGVLQTALEYASEDKSRIPALIGIGNPKANNQEPLPFARMELETIARFFNKSNSNCLFGEKATEENVIDKAVEATHLHFACHSRFFVDNVLDSALYLAGDDILTLHNLLEGKLKMPSLRLAVLSSCQTGITDFQHMPNEAIGFPTGFLQAGVPAVISTLWAVNDLSTMLLMERFYQLYLQDNLDMPVALRQAQLWLRDVTAQELAERFRDERMELQSNRLTKAQAGEYWRRFAAGVLGSKPFAHPYYWAAFTFTGA